MPTLMELYCPHERFRPAWSSSGVSQWHYTRKGLPKLSLLVIVTLTAVTVTADHCTVQLVQNKAECECPPSLRFRLGLSNFCMDCSLARLALHGCLLPSSRSRTACHLPRPKCHGRGENSRTKMSTGNSTQYFYCVIGKFLGDKM